MKEKLLGGEINFLCISMYVMIELWHLSDSIWTLIRVLYMRTFGSGCGKGCHKHNQENLKVKLCYDVVVKRI